MSRKIAVKPYLSPCKRSGFIMYLSLPAAVLCCVVFCVSGSGICSEPAGEERVVIIDPGHGGADSGVEGHEGGVEKTVSLDLAKKLEDALEDRYRVFLTRKGDYEVSLSQRVSIANHRKGDLFISLHAGGAFRRVTDRRGIYFHPGGNGDDREADFAADEGSGVVPWHLIQQRHAAASSLLAETLQKRLALFDSGLPPEIMEARLAVLKGLDMPAAVVEYGYLTNPKTAGILADQQYLENLAGALAAAIFDFFAARQAE